MSDLELDLVQPWAPHPYAAPRTHREGEILSIATNGSHTCSGGWQLHYSGVAPGQAYHLDFLVEHEEVDSASDSLHSVAFWDNVASDQAAANPSCQWEYMLPKKVDTNVSQFSRRLIPPEGADSLTLRYTFRWSATGKSAWRLPQIDVTPVRHAQRQAVKVAVVTGSQYSRRELSHDIQANLDFYGQLCETACVSRPDLIVLPECALQSGILDNPLKLAVDVPGPETDFFAQIARRHQVRILVGLWERNEDAVHNSAVLISPQGVIEGTYRKVHLAVGGESESGILPGNHFPIFDTEIGRIGCNICVDNSTLESSRLIGLQGADFLLLPIEGDNRADRWNLGSPIFNESRWQSIMRTRALDNQLCLVAARNAGLGSCIIDRKGDILAWNEGDQDFIETSVILNDGYRAWNGGCLRDIQWNQRRPHAYRALSADQLL